ncbi:DUF2147 domain-containing protein [Caviibacter abscessus]|uniref:DUF2147 domain-containing protein n=1 Tax=Caviibacter abscessus TaxID=1766719 RepID=UPI000835B0D1|nr:DUF2147 domain-containing protein [Caviibacter abscessus]
MKKILLLIFTMLSFTVFSNISDVYGKWVTEKTSDGNWAVVEFYERNGKIYGRFIFMTDKYDSDGKLKRDIKNPDPAKRDKTLQGLEFLTDFVYVESENKYINGTIYDPSSGNSYGSYLQVQNNGTLKLRGYLKGFKFLGKTQIWKRY